MKKEIVITAVLIIMTIALGAQSKVKIPTQKSKINYSFAWGLIKSKSYSNDHTKKYENETPKVSHKPRYDSEKLELKSILWGAIQWTVK